jgi:hypothetical protein
MHRLTIFDRRLFRAAVTAALVAYGYLSHGQAPKTPEQLLQQEAQQYARALQHSMDAVRRARTPDEKMKAIIALGSDRRRRIHELGGEVEREAKSDTDSDFEKLLGTWVGVAIEHDGQAPRALKAPQEVARLVFKRKRLKSPPGQWTSLFEYEYRFTFNDRKVGEELGADGAGWSGHGYYPSPDDAIARNSPDDAIARNARGPKFGGPNPFDRATFKMWDVDLKRTPMEFWLSDCDFFGTETWWRVNTFELDGDRMVWCLAGIAHPDPEDARNGVLPAPNIPKEGEKLKTFPGSGRALVHFEREKEGLAEKHTAATVKSPAKAQRQMPAKKPRSQGSRSRPSAPE